MRRRTLIGILVAPALLAALVVGFDPGRIAADLASAPPALVAAGLLLVQAQIVLSALRWRFTAGRLGQALPVGRAIGDYYLGTLLNQLLPGGVAGDAVRAVRQRGGDGDWRRPAQAVLLERIAGQGVFFLLAGLGLLLWPLAAGGESPEAVRRLFLVALPGLAALGFAALLLSRFATPRLRAWGRGAGSTLASVFIRNGAWAVQASLSLAIVGSYVATFMIASAAVGAPLPAIAAVTAVPLCLLMMLIPATVAGWGAREAAAAALWPLFGHAPSAGIAAGVLYGVLSLAGAAPGAILILSSLRPGWRRR